MLWDIVIFYLFIWISLILYVHFIVLPPCIVMICQQCLILNDHKAQVYKMICSSRLMWKTVQSPLPTAFLITMYMTKRFKSINHVTHNTHNRRSWWDLGDKVTFEWLRLSSELATKSERVLQLTLEARVVFILSRWVPAHHLGIGWLCPSHLFASLLMLQAAWLSPSYEK